MRPRWCQAHLNMAGCGARTPACAPPHSCLGAHLQGRHADYYQQRPILLNPAPPGPQSAIETHPRSDGGRREWVKRKVIFISNINSWRYCWDQEVFCARLPRLPDVAST